MCHLVDKLDVNGNVEVIRGIQTMSHENQQLAFGIGNGMPVLVPMPVVIFQTSQQLRLRKRIPFWG